MRDDDYPALYGAADAASIKAQNNFFRALGVNLGGLIAASILSVINSPTALFAIVQAALLLVSLGFAVYLAYKQPQKVWYSTRALSESIKTVTWKYMMRAEPFDVEDSDARHLFLEVLRKILATNKQVCAHAVNLPHDNQITKKMAENREKTLVDRRLIYLNDRINDQLKWYRDKARLNDRYSSLWFSGLIAVNGVAVMLALVRIAYPDSSYWPTDIFVTTAGALMAWIQTRRFQELAASYSLAAHEISLLREGAPDDRDENNFSEYVADSENAFSREHTQWQARRDTD